MISIKELRSKTKSNRRGYFYKLMDYLAYYPAKLLLYTKMSPNQITIFWIIIQIAAALSLTTGIPRIMFLSLVIFQSMFILDCSDGIIARYKKQFSLNGIYLDHLGHYIANPTLLICYGIGVFRMSSDIAFIFIGIAAALFFLLNKATTLNLVWYSDKSQRTKVEQSLHGAYLHKQNNFMYSVFELFRIEYLFNLMFWGTLLGFFKLTLIVYALFLLLELIRKVAMQLRNNYRNEN